MEKLDPTGGNLNALLRAPELSSVKSQIEDIIECIKKVSTLRVMWNGESPELKSLFIIVNELYNCKVDISNNNSEEKEREIFKKYFNQIIDNLLDGNTKGKHS